MQSYPSPVDGASMLLSFRLSGRSILIIGSGSLAASRAFAALEAGSRVIILTHGGFESSCDELRWRAEQGQVTIFNWDALPTSSPDDHGFGAFDSYLATLEEVMLVCVTDTMTTLDAQLRRSRSSAAQIHRICHKHRIPVNVTDMADLCDFSFASTHRFLDVESGEPTALQIAVTTNGQGCRLAGRVRREIVAKLPREVGSAVRKMGELRNMAKESQTAEEHGADDGYEVNGVATPNHPVMLRNSTESPEEAARRRMKWVAQISEYWPLDCLASMSGQEMSRLLADSHLSPPPSAQSEIPMQSPLVRDLPPPSAVNSQILQQTMLHNFTLSPLTVVPRGRILLVGSGPGDPGLLTLATYTALTQEANLILSDKLVPSAVLELVPSKVEIRIARKFPGNADDAQTELMEAAVEGASRGLTVVRLKQGDPVVYGRAGEEVLYFRSHGFEPIIVPGVSSALAAPTLAGIPVTQRGVADSFIVCTGVGRQGRQIRLPGYERGRTLLILMGVARLGQVIDTLTEETISPTVTTSKRDGKAYPSHIPIAIIERGSMPDQRVITSTLANVVAALESVGEQRPPGMLVVGWSVLALWREGDMTILDDGAEQKDDERIRAWLGLNKWRITEGLRLNVGEIKL